MNTPSSTSQLRTKRLEGTLKGGEKGYKSNSLFSINIKEQLRNESLCISVMMDFEMLNIAAPTNGSRYLYF